MFKIYIITIAVMSVITFILFAADKAKAKKTGSIRIPEMVLLSFVALGGGVGGIFGMYALRHKTDFKSKFHFAITLVLSLIAQILAFVYLLKEVLPLG